MYTGVSSHVLMDSKARKHAAKRLKRRREIGLNARELDIAFRVDKT